MRRDYAGSVLLDGGSLGDVGYLAGAILETMGVVGYDAVGMHYRDYLLGEEFTEAAEDAEVLVVSSGEPVRELSGPVHRQLLFTAGGKRIGVASFFWPSGVPDYTPATLAGRAVAVLRELRAKCDVVVLLSQLPTDMDETLLRFPQVQGLADIIIGGASQTSATEPRVVNGTTILPTAHGRWDVGVVEVAFDPQGRPEFDSRLEPVDDALPPHPEVLELIEPVLARRQKERSRASLRDVSTGGFVRPSVCGKCHQAELADWQQTAHARALDTLRRRDEMTGECLPCHSEAYRRTRQIPGARKPDEGVQCSTCHGAGLFHSRRGQPGDVTAHVDAETCLLCHTAEQGAFNYAQDVKRVDHEDGETEAPAPDRTRHGQSD